MDTKGGMINWKTGTDIYTPSFIKQATNENLLYSTGQGRERYDLFVGHILS